MSRGDVSKKILDRLAASTKAMVAARHEKAKKNREKYPEKYKKRPLSPANWRGISESDNKKLTKEKERLVAENTDSRKVNTYSMSELRKYIKQALKATRRSTQSYFAGKISDDPKPGDRMWDGEKIHEALEAAKKRISEKAQH